LREEQYDGAGRYLVAGALHVPGELAGPLSALALAAAAAWVWVRRPPAPVGAAVLMGTLLAAASPVQPWYAVTLLAFATLAVAPRWTAIVAAGYPYFFALILLHPDRTAIGQLAYTAGAAAVLLPSLIRLIRLRLDRPESSAAPRPLEGQRRPAAEEGQCGAGLVLGDEQIPVGEGGPERGVPEVSVG
jgi:hypothetical protein